MPKNGFVMRFFGCAQLPVGVVGVPRRTNENRDFKLFLVGCAQIGNGIQTPAKPCQHRLRGRLHAWWSNGGQDGQ